jgi:hypothetical protein
MGLHPSQAVHRYSLRILFVLVTVVCLSLTWYASRLRIREQQRIRAEWWEKRGAYVSFERGMVTSIQPFGPGISGNDLSKLGDFPEIRMLFLQDIAVDDAALSHLPQLKNLEWLVLSDRQVSDEVAPKIAKLSSLHHLFLDGTQITDAALASIATMRTLKYVNLKATHATDAGIEKLRRELPTAEIEK